jgi:hypothetical protein
MGERRGRQQPIAAAVPLDLRTALHRAAKRLAHAADLATICADGTMPERGAGYVLSILTDLREELAVFRTTVSDLPPEP